MEHKITADFENKKQGFGTKLNDLVEEYKARGLDLRTIRALLQIQISRISDELI